MNTMQTANRIHPLIATAAVSVTLVSLLGMAAITGILPKSHSSIANATPATTMQVAALATPVLEQKPLVRRRTESLPVRTEQSVKRIAHVHSSQLTAPVPAPAPQPAPVARNSPVGIGVGAVIGGLLGSQVGGGDGKTLATIAGAVGGGYIGNEVAKRNQ